jgi:sodium-dependent dicarboxylate transporter 2/3/5
VKPSLLERWEAARTTSLYRLGGVLVGLVLLLVVLHLPLPEGLSEPARRTAGVAVLMAVWWLGGVLPMSVTALVPLVALPLLGVTTATGAAAPYAHPLNFLMLGGFVMGHAIEEVGLHKKIVVGLLTPRFIRERPSLVVLAMMVAAALLSGMVSNTATMVMMLPIAFSLAATLSPDPSARSGFALALAYACSIGGVGTLIGTPPNAVLAGLSPRPIAFVDWMLIGVPFVVLALPVAWLVVSRMALPKLSGVAGPLPKVPDQPGRKAVLFVLGLAMLAFLTRRGLGPIPAWGPELHDAWIAIGAAVLLFMIPAHVEGRETLLTWHKTERAVPWSVLLLLGGGFSLAAAITSSGLTAWLAAFTAHLGLLPTWAAVIGLCLSISFITELTSNTATTQIALPLLAAGAEVAGVDPLMWMVPATISASCAFMMPVATAPNAIACEAGGVEASKMATVGVVLNVLCALIAAAVVLVILPWLGL